MQPALEIDVLINGVSRGTLSSLVKISVISSGRVGYFRFDTSGGDALNTLTLNNRSVPGGTDRDGWAIDHPAFNLVPQTTAVPVPAALPLFLAGLGLMDWRMRWRGGNDPASHARGAASAARSPFSRRVMASLPAPPNRSTLSTP